MKFEHLLLGYLGMRHATGYDLKRWLDSELGRIFRPSTQLSQIYRALAKLAEQGWVVFDVERQEGRPDAKIYRLTPDGHRELRAWLATPYQPTPRFAEPEFLTRFVFAGALLSDAEVAGLVRIELEARRAQLAEYRERARPEERWAPELDYERAMRALDRAHEYEDRALERHVRWLEETLDDLVIRGA